MTDRPSFPPRLSPGQTRIFTGLTDGQLKTLRRNRAIRFYRIGHRTILYDRDSLLAWLQRHAIEPIGGAS